MFCPSCARPLEPRELVTQVHAGGARVQWRRYECAGCGPFEIRAAAKAATGQHSQTSHNP